MSDLVRRLAMGARAGTQFGGQRDMYEALGYNRNPKYDDYRLRYDRQDIAGRVVDAPPQATWRKPPEVYEDDDTGNETEFEAAWASLTKRLPVYHYLERVDRLAGIGRYAILLIGVRGQPDLSTPLAPGSLKSPDDILYLAPYSEKHAQIKTWDTNAASARFGKPLTYQLDVSGDLEGAGFTSSTQQVVHHTRVIHVAEGLLEDEVYGRPRQQRVFNLLDDLMKVVGGSAEMFWVAAYRGLHAKTSDGAEPPDDQQRAEIRTALDEYIHGLRRVIRTDGVDINPLSGEVADPKNQFDVIMSLLSGATGIPKRILLGSEQGELASSQDETNWNARIAERQENYAEPQILRPFIDRLVYAGALPRPADGYEVEWPNLFALDETQQADVGLKKAQAIQAYAPFGETDKVVPIREFREKILGLDPEPPQPVAPGDDDYADDDAEGADDPVLQQIRQRLRGEVKPSGSHAPGALPI